MTSQFNFHGGDVQGYSIEALPENAKKVEHQPVAFGETSGHCHILTGDVELFQDDEGSFFAVVGSDGAFHQHIKESTITARTWKARKNISNADHTKECPINPGVYRIGIHRQYDPFEGVFKEVED